MLLFCDCFFVRRLLVEVGCAIIVSQFLALLLMLMLLGSNKVMVVVLDTIAVLPPPPLLLLPPVFSAVGEEVMASCFGDGQKGIPRLLRENTTSDIDDETAQKDFCSLDMLVPANPKYTAVARISLRDFVLCSR